MLKIIRKYQLVILAIGGSLLMVVFLFEPIIGKISPDSRKAAVAKLADGTTFNGFDIQRASFDLSVLKRVYPRVFAPFEQGGLGLDPRGEESTERHWLLLSKQANDAGLIGDAGEGQTWISILAQREAAGVIQQQMQLGAFTDQAQAQQALADMTTQFENGMARDVALASGMMRGVTQDDVYRTLATARGIERLYQVFTSLPAFSDLGAMQAAKDRHDTIAIDGALVKGELFADAIPVPSNSELQSFFELYSADAPSDNEYGIGYTQPARAKIGWITLDKEAIESSVEIDRVELNKIWRIDRKLPEGTRKYPGDFAGERRNIEAAYRVQRAFDIMFEADKIIRSQILQATRGLSREGNFYVLPEDWDSTRPTLEAIAQAVVDGLKEQLKVTAPLPSVEIHTDRWLTNEDISKLGGFGTSTYRIGSKAFPAYAIPQASESDELASLLTIQPGILVADPAAEDQQGNRYYALVYDTKPEGPAESIDDVGYDTVLRDFRTIKAYEMLKDNLSSIVAQAEAANDLAPAIDAALALGQGSMTRPGVARNLRVSSDAILRGRLASFVEPGLNTKSFRDAVIAASSGLDELASPEAVAQSPIIVGAPIPSVKSIGLAKVIAPRPLTIEDFNSEMSRILMNESGGQIREALVKAESWPFSLDSLTDRYGYVRVKKRADEVDAPAATEPDSKES